MIYSRYTSSRPTESDQSDESKKEPILIFVYFVNVTFFHKKIHQSLFGDGLATAQVCGLDRPISGIGMCSFVEHLSSIFPGCFHDSDHLFSQAL